MSRTQAVQGSGNQFLANPSRPGDEDAAEMRGDAVNLRKELQHERAAANHPIELKILEKVILQLQTALPVFRYFLDLADFLPKLVRRTGLGKIVCGALLNRFDSRFC